MTGFPKKAYNLGWTPLLALIFLIAPSNLLSAKPFSLTKNFLNASSSIFFYHFKSISSTTYGLLNSCLAY